MCGNALHKPHALPGTAEQFTNKSCSFLFHLQLKKLLSTAREGYGDNISTYGQGLVSGTQHPCIPYMASCSEFWHMCMERIMFALIRISGTASNARFKYRAKV